MSRQPLELSPAAWAVLGVVAEGPTHGFALAQILAADGALGQVWTLPRPMVYRELSKLVALGLVAERATEHSHRGPARTIVAVTPAGRRTVKDWLAAPVDHVRDVRSSLLLKLALLQRAGVDPRPLLRAQQQRLGPQLAGLEQLRDRAVGFERLLGQWRLASSQATLQFLDAALGDAALGDTAVDDN
jgi:PadR family transcriptional regulator AphA